MRRVRLFGLVALLMVTPAIGQVMKIQRIPTPQVDQVQIENRDLSTAIVQDPAKARETIARLYREKRELNARLTEALATIQQYTDRKGSLVKAYCESREISRNTAGATEDCSASGYICGDVEGTCKRRCEVSLDCAANFTCNPSHVCERTG
jgi:hypothetical protein